MPTLEELLGQINQQQASQPSPDAMETLTSLARQNMTAGLGVDANGKPGFFNPEGGNAAGALGYAGPLRESDKPSLQAAADIPVYNGAQLSPQTIEAQAMAGGPLRSVLPEDKAAQIGSGMVAMSKMGVAPASQTEMVKGIMEKFGLGDNKMSEFAQKLALRRLDKLETPLGTNATKYVNMDTGERADPNMTQADIAKDKRFKPINANQDKQIEALNNLKAHVLLTQQFLDTLPKETGITGRMGNAASAKLSVFMNDPAAVSLFNQADSMTPIATARAFLGSGGRAGPAAAKMLAESNVTKGDDLNTARAKLQNMNKIMLDLAKENGLPTKPYEGILSAQAAGKKSVATNSGWTVTEEK